MVRNFFFGLSGTAYSDGQIYFFGGGELITQPFTESDIIIKDISQAILYSFAHTG